MLLIAENTISIELYWENIRPSNLFDIIAADEVVSTSAEFIYRITTTKWIAKILEIVSFKFTLFIDRVQWGHSLWIPAAV